jgi:hypothetical protein
MLMGWRAVRGTLGGVLALAGLMVCSLASAAGPPRPGHYSSVRSIPEAGDQLGVYLVVHGGPRPSVEFENCEGVCNGPRPFPAAVSGGALRFTARTRLTDTAGRLVADRSYRVVVREVGTRRGPRLVVTSPDVPELHEVLGPVAPD